MSLSFKSRWIYWISALEFLAVGAFYRFPIGDSQLIIDGGARILRGVEPYRSYDFGNFALAGLLFKGLSSVFGSHLTTGLLFFLNVLGLLVFTFALSKISGFPTGSTYLLVPLTLSSRALFANGQITGIILLLISIPLMIKQKSKYYLFISSISLMIALELKLHMALPFCIAVCLVANRKILILLATSLVAFTHTIMGVLFGFSLDLGWAESVKSRSARSFLPGAEFSIWKILNNIVEEPNFLKGASFLTYLILTTILAFTKMSAPGMIFLAATTPLCLIYQHPYDWIPIVICAACLWNSKFRIKVFVLLLLVFLSLINQVINPDLLFSIVSASLLFFGTRIVYSLKTLS